MRAYLGIFQMRMKVLLQYRMAALAGFGTQLFFGLVMVMIYHAFYESGGGGDMPMTLTQTISYIWLGQGLLGLLPWNGDREIQGMIRSGDFAYELVRPLDLYGYWFTRIVAQRLVATMLRALPLFLLVSLAFPKGYGLGGPSSTEGFLMFLGTLCLGVVLGGCISNVITISVLFTIGDGMERLLPAVVTFFSGMVIPIGLFPEWSQPLFRLLPFSGLVDAPYRFYLGTYDINDLGLTLGLQGIWIFLLWVLGKKMVTVATKRTVVQGG